jgi:hypothetical protein
VTGLDCGTCARRLGVDEAATCRACVADVREHLALIVDLYATLPALLGGLGSNAPDPAGPVRSGERPMPGGDVLVLLAGGSDALAALRRLRAAQSSGKSHEEPAWGADDRDRDPPSVAYELARWVTDWRLTRSEPSASMGVNASAAWLSIRIPWAAARHPAFAEFATDMARLRRRLEHATGTADRPERAGVPCFDCGGDLERGWGHHGREDDWTCRRCRRVYDQAAYLLAVRATLEECG